MAADSVYDDATPGGSSNLVAQYSSSGVRQDRYVQAGVDAPVEMVAGSTTYAYATDGLGSVNRLTDASGATAETYAYDPWGVTTPSGGVANPFQYTARELDSSGLYDYRARSYDPSSNGAHRFLSTDPLGGGYAYVGDSPANYVDPSGMKECSSNKCWYQKGPPASPPPPPTPSFSWERCGSPIAVFLLGILLGAVGLSLSAFGPDAIALFTTRISMFYNFASDFGAIAQNPGNPIAWLTALIDIGMWFWWTVLIPHLGFWAALAVGGSIAADASGWGFLVQLANFIYDIILGFADLVNQNCV